MHVGPRSATAAAPPRPGADKGFACASPVSRARAVTASHHAATLTRVSGAATRGADAGSPSGRRRWPLDDGACVLMRARAGGRLMRSTCGATSCGGGDGGDGLASRAGGGRDVVRWAAAAVSTSVREQQVGAAAVWGHPWPLALHRTAPHRTHRASSNPAPAHASARVCGLCGFAWTPERRVAQHLGSRLATATESRTTRQHGLCLPHLFGWVLLRRGKRNAGLVAKSRPVACRGVGQWRRGSRRGACPAHHHPCLLTRALRQRQPWARLSSRLPQLPIGVLRRAA